MPIRELMIFLPGEIAPISDMINGKESTPRLEALTKLLSPHFSETGLGKWKRYGRGCFDKDWTAVSTTAFAVTDFDAAERAMRDWLKGTEFEGAYGTYHWFEARDEAPDTAPYKSIEVYYDTDKIPAEYFDPLDFRNEAMELIESALTEAEAGEWAGAESGSGEVNFGFEVPDFDRAEKIVRAAVENTPFSGIREITRFELKPDA